MRGTLDGLRRYLEGVGCTSTTWHSLTNCNIPKRRGSIPLLEKAMSKGIIPQDYAKVYFAQIKQQENAIKEAGFSPLYLAFCGDIGNYKTLMAVRYFVIKTVTEGLIPLFLTSSELFSLFMGDLEIHRYTDEITFAVETELKPAKTFSDTAERIPFTSIAKFYDIILVDDLEEEAVPAFEKLILQAYDTETFLIATTNIAPPRRLLESLSEKARSRLLECGMAVHVEGTDKRKRGGER